MRRSKPWLLALAVFTILVLDFAAFDDITTGPEPNYTDAAAIIILSIPALTVIYILVS